MLIQVKMPQELHVVQCCTCEMFQVDIVKKVPKWSCKMCGEKQSLKKVFGKGTGKECRLIVQQLNQNKTHKANASCQSNENTSAKMDFSSAPSSDRSSNMQSKWSDFTRNSDTEDEVAEAKFNPGDIESETEIRHCSNHTIQNEMAKSSFDCRIKETTEIKVVSGRAERTKLESEVGPKDTASSIRSIFEDNDIDAINFD